ncbi:hypothetical protein QC764_605180 [Podospora pseudoanserina]|uniref:Biogenesis of lysosome-related organelles complex 1 subunit KXD1 n=1 Tax=Podospora pseudoanserina TaxID=2609844 RepID=A0ABR0HS71_9PEZI|nr:hypothetical protein QC764_605180 [Podospora pseudoanserina]
MSHYSTPYYPTTTSIPIPPTKSAYQSPYSPYYPPAEETGTYSVSPPELTDDGHSLVSTGGGSYSVGPSGSVSSGSDYYYGGGSGVGGDVAAGNVANVDLNEYMAERFSEGAMDSVGGVMDGYTVRQAKASGHLNAKHRELLELQAKAQARLAKTRARFAQGMEDAREVREDLEWTQRKVASLKTKASKKHTKEYTKARARYPSPDY